MPTPTNERQALERELVELPDQIAGYQRDLDAAPTEKKPRRERLDWQIRNLQKRLEVIEARLAAISAQQSSDV